MFGPNFSEKKRIVFNRFGVIREFDWFEK